MTTTHASEAPAATMAEVVAGARVLVAELATELWAAKSPDELLATNLELERLRSTIASVQAIAVVEIDETDAARSAAWATTKDYLTATSGARRGWGGRLLRTGEALVDDQRATWAALHSGAVSPEQAEVVVKVITLLPVETGLRADAEALLLAEAAHLNATELQIAGDHLLEVLDPDGAARREERRLDRHERSAHLNRFLAIVDDGLGGVRVRGRGTVEDAAIIKAALAALSAPLPGTDPDCGVEGGDPRDHGARTWDALVEACQTLHDSEVLPESHGAKSRVMVLISHDALVRGVGTATLDTGDRLSATAVRKLACDADLIPVTLGTEGEVLDVGRSLRLASTAIWKALVARDRQCSFPGCRRPPIACDAHHVVHWADGGATSLDNMVLLCRAHHTVVHTTPWRVRLNPLDRRPEFRPPPGRHAVRPEFRERLDARDDWVRERRARQ